MYTTFSHFLTLILFSHILIYITMAQNSLISDIRLEFKELESMRKNLITKTLQSQRQISAQIEHLKAEFKENVKILESLAEEPSTSKQEPQPEGEST